MKIKEKMMESMMGKMSKQEKQEMMEKMMEQFFSGMTEEEKKEMMKEMMSKMMQQMMGGSMSMMDMMGSMMGQGTDEEGADSKPWDMCRSMMGSMNKANSPDTLLTAEIQGMFEEWVQQINDEILVFLSNKTSASITQIAEHLKITKQSAIYLVSKLAQKEQIKLEVSKHDTKE